MPAILQRPGTAFMANHWLCPSRWYNKLDWTKIVKVHRLATLHALHTDGQTTDILGG